ncbi:MAG: hypothetical protein PWQ09_1172 [Candidatus Cloacimonadota bacterium]|jgi:hypothetical protein|nr:hypothetical protein [Candidatus Cloacimonadota bacterium]
MFIPFIASYAETHYHLKYLFPKYFTKFPEIIFDIPKRVCTNRSNTLPLLLIIKDADKFPIKLLEIEIKILGYNSYKEIFNRKIETPYFSVIIDLDISHLSPGKYQLIAEIKVTKKNKTYLFINDNYQGLTPVPFQFHITDKLPYPTGWYAGEPHYHSNYTNDQVEFGADLGSTTVMAKAMGLDWFFVTDHSYDLDDKPDNYLQFDPHLSKWKDMQSQVSQHDSPDCRILAGEELSVGNFKHRNVHLLIINNQKFLQGFGDSAEKWFHNKPTMNISNITKEPAALYIAAHPNERVPLIQKISLRRSNWQTDDFLENNIQFLQIINDDNHIDSSIEYWKELLLAGHKFFLLAGNDAHGNFNLMRQIEKPFLKLFSNRNQIFGNWHTVFKYKENTPIEGLKNKQIIVSNGPFMNFWLEDATGSYHIGQTIAAGNYKINWELATTEEFGDFTQIDIWQGYQQRETRLKKQINGASVYLPASSYLRFSGKTQKGGRVFCNPIWLI